MQRKTTFLPCEPVPCTYISFYVTWAHSTHSRVILSSVLLCTRVIRPLPFTHPLYYLSFLFASCCCQFLGGHRLVDCLLVLISTILQYALLDPDFQYLRVILMSFEWPLLTSSQHRHLLLLLHFSSPATPKYDLSHSVSYSLQLFIHSIIHTHSHTHTTTGLRSTMHYK